MDKAVLISINPQWCKLIVSEEKTVEVRKNRPSLKPPFKCYIYCTASKNDARDLFRIYWLGGNSYVANKKVVGEFVCDEIVEYPFEPQNDGEHYMPFRELEKTCLDGFQIYDYLKTRDGYGWHISDLVIYDEPKELSEFKKYNRNCQLTVPPQSWCYVEELK